MIRNLHHILGGVLNPVSNPFCVVRITYVVSNLSHMLITCRRCDVNLEFGNAAGDN